MSDLYEFLFCPQHGVFAPQNLPTVLPVAAASIGTVAVSAKCCWKRGCQCCSQFLNRLRGR